MAGQFKPGRFWAEAYNAEHALEKTPEARDAKLLEKEAQYNKMQGVPVGRKEQQAIIDTVMSGAMKAEMEATGASPDFIVSELANVSKVESAGGAFNQPSPTGAAGFLQVTDGTFRDLLKRNVVGPKALKVLGKTKKELLGMSNKQRQKYLTENHEAAAMFGLGAYLNKLQGVR